MWMLPRGPGRLSVQGLVPYWSQGMGTSQNFILCSEATSSNFYEGFLEATFVGPALSQGSYLFGVTEGDHGALAPPRTKSLLGMPTNNMLSLRGHSEEPLLSLMCHYATTPQASYINQGSPKTQNTHTCVYMCVYVYIEREI